MKDILFTYLQGEFGLIPKDYQLDRIIKIVEDGVPKYDKCPNCGGTGIIKDGKYTEDCMKCYGSGRIEAESL